MHNSACRQPSTQACVCACLCQTKLRNSMNNKTIALRLQRNNCGSGFELFHKEIFASVISFLCTTLVHTFSRNLRSFVVDVIKTQCDEKIRSSGVTNLKLTYKIFITLPITFVALSIANYMRSLMINEFAIFVVFNCCYQLFMFLWYTISIRHGKVYRRSLITKAIIGNETMRWLIGNELQRNALLYDFFAHLDVGIFFGLSDVFGGINMSIMWLYLNGLKKYKRYNPNLRPNVIRYGNTGQLVFFGILCVFFSEHAFDETVIDQRVFSHIFCRVDRTIVRKTIPACCADANCASNGWRKQAFTTCGSKTMAIDVEQRRIEKHIHIHMALFYF